MNDFFYWVGVIFCVVCGLAFLAYLLCETLWFCLKRAKWTMLLAEFMLYRKQFIKWRKEEVDE